MFSYWTLLHYRHPRINKKATSSSLCVACIINTQRGTSASFSSHIRKRSAGAGEPCNINGFFLTQLCLSVFPEYLNALQNSTRVVTLLVNSSCSILEESLVLHCHFLLLFPRTCLPTEEIYEQQSRINHLPSSTVYIQAFLFLKCHFPVLIHSFSKCTWSFFVPECSQPTAALSCCFRGTNPHCSISALYEGFTHEGMSYSFSRQKKKLNLRKQFSRAFKADSFERTNSQQSPGTQAQLSVVFTVTSHSPATPACIKSGTLFTLLIQYSFKSSPCCSEQGNTKVLQWLTHSPRASVAGLSSPLKAQGWQELQEDMGQLPPTATCPILGTASKQQVHIGQAHRAAGSSLCSQFLCLSPSPWEPCQPWALWTALSISNTSSKTISNRLQAQVVLVENHST